MVPWKSTDEEVLFKWSHDRVLSTDVKVRLALHVSVIDSGSEEVSVGSGQCAKMGRTSRPVSSVIVIQCSLLTSSLFYDLVLTLLWHCFLVFSVCTRCFQRNTLKWWNTLSKLRVTLKKMRKEHNTVIMYVLPPWSNLLKYLVKL